MDYRTVAFMGLAFYLSACGTSQSLDDFREDGQSISRSLLKTLRAIKSDEELSAAVSKLEKHYNDLTDVMIAAHQWMDAHPDARPLPLSKELVELNISLNEECNRLYRLERGRVLLEKAQERALEKLDSYLQDSNKSKVKKHAPPKLSL